MIVCRCSGIEDEFRFAEHASEFMLGIRQRNQLLLKWHALEEDYPLNNIRPVGKRLERASVTVVVRATEQEAATMIVLREQLE
jgi:hypothetical protein